MKKNMFYMLTGLLALAGIQSCENPLKDVNILVSSEILKYTTLLHVSDTEGEPLSNLSVTIKGRDAAYIYNLEGRKQFKLDGGLLNLGIHPEHEPTPGNPIVFQVELSGSGYLTQVIPVTIVDQQFSSINAISVMDLDAAPAGVTVYTPTVALVNNAIAKTLILTTPLSNASEQSVQITLPVGTQFLDENGNILTGTELTASIINADTDKEGALSIFPGGSLATSNIYLAESSNAYSGVFNPAAFTNIEFFVGGVPVRRFSQPIEIAQQLDPGFHNVNTDAPIALGDQLTIFSYFTHEARWDYEQEATVEADGDALVSTFSTDHLTWFLSGNFLQACEQPATIQLEASWFDSSVSYPLTIEAVVAGKVAAAITVSINADNRIVKFNYLPTQGVTIRVRDNRGAILGEQAVNATCGGTTILSLNDPATVNDPTVTLQLYVRCPGQSEVISVLPTFYLYYKEHNSSDDYAFLGVVTDGLLSTRLLTVETVVYDFKAVWGNNIKIVGGHRVQEDNSGTVGIEPGDIIGTKAGATNLAILSEKCSEL